MSDTRSRIGELTRVVRSSEKQLRGLAWKTLKIRGGRPQPEDLEDMIMDAYLTATRRLEAGEQVRNFDAWFKKVLFNTCLNEARRRGRRREQPWSEAIEWVLREERVLSELETTLDLDRLLATLDDEQAAAVVRHTLEGYTSVEIGARLGLEPAAVRQKKRRTLATLAQRIA